MEVIVEPKSQPSVSIQQRTLVQQTTPALARIMSAIQTMTVHRVLLMPMQRDWDSLMVTMLLVTGFVRSVLHERWYRVR
ncbi:hypothetical protein Pla22_17190 [Rubripirellula amarantea]|uniref:Uncharacterized protein n=1 Tax=Rubripirellula amarantea TaxID=2527999 RepID=A0A5C5WT30_9BACT|nr:hypothetical protein Pla22_17190 [Rubripirellula amarantea]